MTNPLLTSYDLPPFNSIKPEHIEPAIDSILENNRAAIAKLLEQSEFTWQNFITPLETISDHLDSAWSNISHLNAVVNSPELRDVYNKVLPKITEYHTELSQNENFFQAIKAITESEQYLQLDKIQQKILQEHLRDFHLAGVDLPPEQKKRYAELEQQLSELMNKFEENVLDATHHFSHLVTDANEIKGLPEHALMAAQELAKSKQLEGWLFNLEAPSYLAIMSYAEHRPLRELMYRAYSTRASDVGPNASQWNNAPIIQQILTVRYELAALLGFANYAELSLATKTANNSEEVLDFLNQLLTYATPIAQHEFAELSQFAKQHLQIDNLQAWDILFSSEKMRQHKFNLAEEDLRPYFPEDQALLGMFTICERLFNIKIKESQAETWHKDVRFFDIYKNNKLIGQFYADLYARPNKRGGAWMAECRSRRRLENGELQTPITFLTCNFSKPVGDRPALFLHDEVVTLFHEFGHTLNELLSEVDYVDASGTRHVPWDVVELPSQFLENWCWERDALQLISKHYQSGEALPEALFNKLDASKTFQAGMQTLRQVEFSLFDFRLHAEFDPQQTTQLQDILTEVRARTLLYPVPEYNRFANSFAHIFGGSYGAGYYSYKWAEVWAADAYAEFEEKGIMNPDIGNKFLNTILARGSAEAPLQMFIEFRGRAPKIDALLRQMGDYGLSSA